MASNLPVRVSFLSLLLLLLLLLSPTWNTPLQWEGAKSLPFANHWHLAGLCLKGGPIRAHTSGVVPRARVGQFF